jgi:hypothetical protein
MGLENMNLLLSVDAAVATVPVGASDRTLIEVILRYRAMGKPDNALSVWMDAGTALTVAHQLLDVAQAARTGGKTPPAN